MTQENRTVRKSRSICVLLVVFMFSGVVSAFAAPAPGWCWKRKLLCSALDVISARSVMVVMARASIEEALRLIQEGADVNVADRNGMTLLMFAVQGGLSPDVLRVLIEGGADVNAATSRGGMTPFILAALFNSNPDVLRILIESGADVNADLNIVINGRTLFKSAVWFNSNPNVLRVLIENGADVNAVGSAGETPLMLAIQGSWNRNCILRTLLILIEKGADVNAANNAGETPLMLAAERLDTRILRILIDNGADVNAVDNTGRTPLMRAIAITNLFTHFAITHLDRAPSLDTVRMLIESGADVNAVDNDGWTPLMQAVDRNPCPEIVRMLIESGAL